MHAALRQRVTVLGGIFTSADAYACGYDRPGLARLTATGEVVRLRRGAYVDAAAMEHTTREQRHGLRVRAILRAAGPATTLVPSHHSALALGGLPLFGVDEDQVHFTRRSPGRTHRTNGVTVHVALGAEAFLLDGACRLHPAIAVVQTAAVHGVEAAVVAADEAIRTRLLTRDELGWALRHSRLREGADLARAAVARADGRSESVGESRARVLFGSLDLPAPELQVNLRDDRGLAGRVDFLFRRQRTVVEFDGAVKYAGADGRGALMREKQREDRLRALGYEVVRLTWADLDDAVRVWRLVTAGFARGARR